MISPPTITIAIGCSISWPGRLPAITSGITREPGRERGHHDRREPLARAAQHQLRAERLALVAFEVLVVVDHHDAGPGRDPEDREEPDQRRRARPRGRAEVRRDHATRQRDRQVEEREPREPPRVQRDPEQQEHEHAGDERDRAASGSAPPGVRRTRPAARRGTRAGSRHRRAPSRTSPTTEPRSRPSTFASTSIRRESPSRSIALGVGRMRTSATCLSTICPPSGVLSGRLMTSVKLFRVSGVLQTLTSYALPSRKMSPTSSPFMRVAAARRTSPGLSP